MIKGRCFCGNIHYQAQGDEFTTVNCHCSMCRRVGGAPYVTWFVVPEEQFSFTKGNPKELESSDHGTRSFCADCGTPLICVHPNEPNVAVTLGSLDDPEALTPSLEIYTDTKLGWTDQIQQLKKISN